jgi:transglutaminase-like putative cysteine protease
MTTLKLFCKIPNPLRIIRPAAVAALAAISVVALASIFGRLSSRVLADTAPDWLRAAAHQTLPEYPKDAVAVILLDEEQTTVKDNGDIETRHRRAYKLLRPEAREHYGYAGVQFDNETKLSFFKAWTITADGKEMELKEKDAVEFSLTSFEVFTDARAKGIKFSAADPGNIVGYEYVQKHRPFVFEDDWQFQSKIPTRRARFSLQLPPGWEFSEYWANFPKQQPQSSANNFYVWEVENVPAVDVEPDMPPFLTVASRMDIKYFPREPALRAKTTGSWNDIGVWYANLTSASRVPSPALQQKVAELTAGISDPLKKMQVLAAYVQQQVRYVAIEIGIGGYLPHAAAEVFKNQYGDCKDKATLMSTMLKQIGIDSYYVYINTERGIFVPDFPSLRGNHMIMAIHLPPDVPTANLYATVDDPQLGRLLFFDPTDEFVPLGYLPSQLQQNYGLVVTSDSGKLFLLPTLPPATNRLLRTATLTLTPTGNLGGEVNELRWGAPAGDSRAQFIGSSPSDRAKVFEKFLGTFLNNFTLTNASVGNLDQYDANFTLHYQFIVQGYAKTAGDLLILRPRVVGEKGSNILTGKPRKYPIEFEGTTLQSDVFDITLPAGYVVDELPQPVEAKCDYATYKSDVEVKDNILHYKRTYEIKGVVVPTEKLLEVRDFFHQVAAAEKSSAVLRRANP